MSIQQMLLGGGSGVQAILPGGTTYSETLAPGSISVNFSVFSNGELLGDGTSQAIDHDWYLPNVAAIGDNYWVRATVTGGTNPTSGPAVSTWLALSTSRQWTNTRTTTVGTKTTTFLVEIATDAAGVNVVSSGTYIFSAILS